MKLLVTGGCGFIGSNFIRYMLKKYPGYQIVNLDKRTYTGNPANLEDLEDNPNYSFVKGDICDPVIVNEIMKKKATISGTPLKAVNWKKWVGNPSIILIPLWNRQSNGIWKTDYENELYKGTWQI